MEKYLKSLSILLGYIKIIILFKTHFKISLLLFYFITILAPKLKKFIIYSKQQNFPLKNYLTTKLSKIYTYPK